ncbi:MAG: nucleotidyltransferase domain-containing protein [Anaerolineae bacterium]
MYSVEYRDQVRDHILQLAANDPRVTAGAAVGSLALGGGDRWSDLDLTFAVADGVPVYNVLEDWTGAIRQEFGAALLFDLPSGPSIYRVFLLPGCLQFDLSFTPASKFGATGPRFKLLFGSAVERPFLQPSSADELFGYAVHHVLRGRFCIERGRTWQAEYWISSARDYALNIACVARGLPAVYARGYDQLPADILNEFQGSLVRSLEREELMRALKSVIGSLLQVSAGAAALARELEPQLREIADGDWGTQNG